MNRPHIPSGTTWRVRQADRLHLGLLAIEYERGGALAYLAAWDV